MRVLIVESDSRLRRSLRQALEELEPPGAVAEASTPAQALSIIPRAPVDIILLGLAVPSQQEIEDARELRRRNQGVPLVAVCPTTDDAHLLTAITLGASACISRDTSPEFLVSTLARVQEGEHPIQYDLLSHAGAADYLLRWFREYPMSPQGPATPSPLSPRESLILQCVAQGYSNKEIGKHLGVTEQTIKNHLSAILRKVKARDRAHAAVSALINRWITLS